MKKRKLKPFLVPVVYVLSFAMLITSVYFIERIINNTVFKSENIKEVNKDEILIFLMICQLLILNHR